MILILYSTRLASAPSQKISIPAQIMLVAIDEVVSIADGMVFLEVIEG